MGVVWIVVGWVGRGWAESWSLECCQPRGFLHTTGRQLVEDCEVTRLEIIWKSGLLFFEDIRFLGIWELRLEELCIVAYTIVPRQVFIIQAARVIDCNFVPGTLTYA